LGGGDGIGEPRGERIPESPPSATCARRPAAPLLPFSPPSAAKGRLDSGGLRSSQRGEEEVRE
jgi:hypothetical protein